MCGIVGVIGNFDVAQAIYDGLTVLQHRGQDAAGIATWDGRHFNLHKGNGLVRDVFEGVDAEALRGHAGIGHVRYPTAGCDSLEEAQPFYVNSPFGIVLSHNGNLTNAHIEREALFNEDQRHLNTESDSEVLLNIFAHELNTSTANQLVAEDIFKAVKAVHRRCEGAYSVVALIAGHGMLAFRDPFGIRPAVIGKRKKNGKFEYAVASETVALDALGFDFDRDIKPGEAIYITLDGQLFSAQCADNPVLNPCIFEHVYFARPDSMMDDISVYKARLRMGEKLAARIVKEWPEHDIDVVIPIPDTSRTSALPLAHDLGVKYREGFIKNRYIGRTFIMPGQEERTQSVKRKLNAISLEFKGKNVLLVDDSIVRGTTSRQIIQMAREAGANKVYFASAAPPVRYPNVYGIDMPSPQEFIAHNRSIEEIRVELGADKIIYQNLEDLIASCQEGNSEIKQFDTSCFSGDYVTGVDESYLDHLEKQRSDYAKLKRRNG
ncbi:MAG: amidophosphoribosyltransferase [bacterium]